VAFGMVGFWPPLSLHKPSLTKLFLLVVGPLAGIIKKTLAFVVLGD